jgi:hypothetical protein
MPVPELESVQLALLVIVEPFRMGAGQKPYPIDDTPNHPEPHFPDGQICGDNDVYSAFPG